MSRISIIFIETFFIDLNLFVYGLGLDLSDMYDKLISIDTLTVNVDQNLEIWNSLWKGCKSTGISEINRILTFNFFFCIKFMVLV